MESKKKQYKWTYKTEKDTDFENELMVDKGKDGKG